MPKKSGKKIVQKKDTASEAGDDGEKWTTQSMRSTTTFVEHPTSGLHVITAAPLKKIKKRVISRKSREKKHKAVERGEAKDEQVEKKFIVKMEDLISNLHMNLISASALDDKRTAFRSSGKNADVDDEGKPINPHIPQYIAKAPWYLNKEGKSLKHQQSQNVKTYDTEWYQRGAKAGPAATKYRKGACENCGAMTHKTRECCERPRKLGAKWTGRNIAQDEVLKELHLDFQGKRDRWNGYNADDYYGQVISKHEKYEAERRKIRKEEAKTAAENAANDPNAKADRDSDDSSSDEEDKDDEKNEFIDTEEQPVGAGLASQGTAVKTKTTVRNLRIREDKAKYLINLSADSAHYDPKSRSMRGEDLPKDDDAQYAGDFVRASNDAQEFLKQQAFSYSSTEDGNSLHMQAAPSQAELAFKEHQRKLKETREKNKKDIISMYGQRTENQPPPELNLQQSEEYVEYNMDGSIVNGNQKVIPTSKYPEDIFPGNHKSVWGSWWIDGKWGYGCCRQTLKNAYCTGQAGIEAQIASTRVAPVKAYVAPVVQDDSVERAKRKEQEEQEEYNLKRMRKDDPMYNHRDEGI